MTINRIFLDVDGVLADWTGATIRLFGRDPEAVYAGWPEGRQYDLALALGVSANEMWRMVHAHGADFWADLDVYPWAMDLYNWCTTVAPTTLLTAPSLDPCSLAGKLAWMQRHFGRDFRDYLVGPDKLACARPGAVLIDDRESTCLAFSESGGHGVVFPQVWNSLGRAEDPMAVVTRDVLGMLA